MIRIENLYKKFRKNEVLKGINLDLNKEGITAILGPNGSGKTTLIKSVLGLVLPDKGNIYFDEESIKHKYEYRARIAHMPQIANFPENLTSRELLNMIKDLRGETASFDHLIEMFGLRNELPKKMSTLSGGTRQKLNFVMAFMYDVPVIILDEPTTGLDPLALIRMKDYILKEKERGKKILITTHIMSFVEEIADNIIFLLEGKIYFEGKLQELLNMQNETKLETAIANILKKNLS